MSAAVVKDDLQKAFGIGAVQFAVIGSMYFYAYFIMQIPLGILADKIGPKKTVFIFSLIAAVGSIFFGLAPSLNIAYISRFFVGIGVSVVFVCLVKIQSRWFYSRNFALMIGFSGLAANLGAIIAQTPLVIAVNNFGWRNTFVYMGIIMVMFAVLTFIFVKDDPTDMGLPGMDEIENRPRVTVNLNIFQALGSILSNPRTWIISVVYIGLYTGYTVILGTFGTPFLMTVYSIKKVEAANYIISAVVVSAGKISGGTKANIVSKYTEVDLSMRYFNPEARKTVHDAIIRHAKAIAEAYEIKVDVNIEESTPSLNNDESMVNLANEVAKKIMGENCSIPMQRPMASDDMAFYFQRAKGVYAFIGYKNEEKGSIYFPHHEKFKLDEDYFKYGAAMFVQFALDYLNGERV